MRVTPPAKCSKPWLKPWLGTSNSGVCCLSCTYKTEGVQHCEISCGPGLQHFTERLIAIFHDGIENLKAGNDHTGAVDRAWLDVAKLTEKIGGEFRLGFG